MSNSEGEREFCSRDIKAWQELKEKDIAKCHNCNSTIYFASKTIRLQK